MLKKNQNQDKDNNLTRLNEQNDHNRSVQSKRFHTA